MAVFPHWVHLSHPQEHLASAGVTLFLASDHMNAVS